MIIGIIAVLAFAIVCIIGNSNRQNDSDNLVHPDSDAVCEVPYDSGYNEQEKRVESSKINGREYVDLGLSVKWATCNLEGYYAWGETSVKSVYSWENYTYCNGTDEEITKYIIADSERGTEDNKGILDPKDDVAHVEWGGTWRMPTSEELNELDDKCEWTWVENNGSLGYKVTGPNGNSIFLPAEGSQDDDDTRGFKPYNIYWSSSVRAGRVEKANCIMFDETFHGTGSGRRSSGACIRPVSN